MDLRKHIVQVGESPAAIAVLYAGCPKCSIDLIHANPHKPAVRFPNGFTTFRSLVPGEKLVLPEKWFDGELDTRPQAYFSALPYSDGVTPSTLGDAAAGVLGTYAALDTASAKVSSLPQMDIATFNNSVNDASLLIDQSVAEVALSGNSVAMGHAQDTVASTAWALQRNVQLAIALKSGDTEGASAARSGIQDVLSTALSSARLALQAFYDPPPATPAAQQAPSVFPAVVTAAAQAAATAMAADPNYCTAVAQTGSAVNSAIHAFKLAWNASQSPPVPLGTGNYEQATAEVLADVLGGAPLPCDPHPTQTQVPPAAHASPVPVASKGLSAGAVAGLGLLVAGAIGGAVYLSTTRGRR